MEQMYIIGRMEDALSKPLVPKSELKKRLSMIVLSQQGYGPPDTWDEAIDILLNGKEE